MKYVDQINNSLAKMEDDMRYALDDYHNAIIALSRHLNSRKFDEENEQCVLAYIWLASRYVDDAKREFENKVDKALKAMRKYR